jgi:hypothetical protein
MIKTLDLPLVQLKYSKSNFIFGNIGPMQIRGRGGHAAMPHVTVNPVIAAASIVSQLRSLVTCALPPYEPVRAGAGAACRVSMRGRERGVARARRCPMNR